MPAYQPSKLLFTMPCWKEPCVGFQFCRNEPALQRETVCKMPIGDKLKILSCLMAQMLTFAGVRDEIYTRYIIPYILILFFFQVGT